MKVAIALAFAVSAFTNMPVEGVNSTSPGSWTKCIGDEIAKCMSCVLEDTEDLVKAVISAAEENPVGTVLGILKTTKKALQCADACSKASTRIVAQQCGSFYCKTDFCVKCCGEGSWQCLGNDFTPQCAPRMQLSESFVDHVKVVRDEAKEVVKSVLNRAAEKIEQVGEAVIETYEKAINMTKMEPEGVSSQIQKCQCGRGSGNPDSCCSKCKSSKDPHSVPHCPGGGKNTGPFCGNDFHVTEPNACYGETPLCCTNDMGIPVCCRLGQVCHSPDIGNNECRDAAETLVV